jgi:tRNA(Arg) A34 adenosine deaminase TadA
VSRFDAAYEELHPALRRCLELAFATLCGGGLACGSVITDAAEVIVAEGRNRAYDPPGGEGVLQGNPLAHAELNALAEIPTAYDLAGCTLWSSQQPCSMCRGAIEFVGLGQVRFLAADPAFVGTAQAATGVPLSQAAVPPEWPLVANVLFLHNIIVRRGENSEAVQRNRELEPETAQLAIALVKEGALTPGTDAGALSDVLTPVWDRLAAAAALRLARAR